MARASFDAAIAAGADGAREALATFDGPDAYISPAWYPEKQLTGKVVPTCNYVTVQAHGTLSTIHDRPDHVGAARAAQGVRFGNLLCQSAGGVAFFAVDGRG